MSCGQPVGCGLFKGGLAGSIDLTTVYSYPLLREKKLRGISVSLSAFSHVVLSPGLACHKPIEGKSVINISYRSLSMSASFFIGLVRS